MHLEINQPHRTISSAKKFGLTNGINGNTYCQVYIQWIVESCNFKTTLMYYFTWNICSFSRQSDQMHKILDTSSLLLTDVLPFLRVVFFHRKFLLREYSRFPWEESMSRLLFYYFSPFSYCRNNLHYLYVRLVGILGSLQSETSVGGLYEISLQEDVEGVPSFLGIG